jgi:hypothetical protein
MVSVFTYVCAIEGCLDETAEAFVGNARKKSGASPRPSTIPTRTWKNEEKFANSSSPRLPDKRSPAPARANPTGRLRARQTS